MLRARVSPPMSHEPPYVSAWRQELSALLWAIEQIEQSHLGDGDKS